MKYPYRKFQDTPRAQGHIPVARSWMPSLGPLDLPLPWCYEQSRLQKSLQRLSCASSRVGHTSRKSGHLHQHVPNQRISQWFRHHEIRVAASMAPHVSIIGPSFQVTNSAHDVNRIHRLSDPVPHWVAFVSMAMFLPFSTNGLENLKQTKNRLRRQRNNGVAIDLNQLQKQANPKDQKMKHTTQGVALTNLKEKMA